MNLKKLSLISTIVCGGIGLAGMSLLLAGEFKPINIEVDPQTTISSTASDAGSNFWDAYDAAKMVLKNWNAVESSSGGQSPAELKKMKQIYLDIKSSGDLIIAGAVLFSIFTILAIASGILLFIKRND